MDERTVLTWELANFHTGNGELDLEAARSAVMELREIGYGESRYKFGKVELSSRRPTTVEMVYSYAPANSEPADVTQLAKERQRIGKLREESWRDFVRNLGIAGFHKIQHRMDGLEKGLEDYRERMSKQEKSLDEARMAIIELNSERTARAANDFAKRRQEAEAEQIEEPEPILAPERHDFYRLIEAASETLRLFALCSEMESDDLDAVFESSIVRLREAVEASV